MGTTRGGWRKSSYSDTNDCVEIRFAVGRVLVRNSNRPEIVPIAFSRRSWVEFLVALRAGDMRATSDD